MRSDVLSIAVVLLSACGPRNESLIAPAASLPPSELLGTWRGAMESFPVTLRVYGPSGLGLHSEFEIEHSSGQEMWRLITTTDAEGGVSFEDPGGEMVCQATLDSDVLSGECQLLTDSTPAQWLVVHL